MHSTPIAHGQPWPVCDPCGARGRELLARLPLAEPWRSTLEASLPPIDILDEEIDARERELRRLGADHRYVPLPITLPGVACILGFTRAPHEVGAR